MTDEFVIKEVKKGSPADKAGIKAGEYLISVNGEKVKDILEYMYHTSDCEVVFELKRPDGKNRSVKILKDPDENPGLVFETPLMDKLKHCTNKCIFCFMDQLPKGLRKSLYIKDDDYRLSFLQGNYVTLTNITVDEIEGIIKYRISPLNISVHSTNPMTRVKMTGNVKAAEINSIMRRLSSAGITMNCQIVVCPGINDGHELDQTIGDLTSLYPGVNSISVVPVGITKHREGLHPLKPCDRKTSITIVEQVEKWQKLCLEKYGSRIVFAGDEFYISAGKDFPCVDEYEDFPQLENGVGMMPLFISEFNDCFEEYCNLARRENAKPGGKTLSIATGVLAYPYLKKLIRRIESRFPRIKVNIFPVTNEFLGESITVAGLVTGTDLIRQLSGKDLGEKLLIPTVMLKDDENIFLDSVSAGDVERNLGIKLQVVENNGRQLMKNIVCEI